MLVRLVDMKFKEEHVDAFLQVFNNSKDAIASFPGCTHLKLLNDVNDKSRFFTYSHWKSEAHLENYRHSSLFKTTWAKTKILFDRKPVAASFDALFVSEKG